MTTERQLEPSPSDTAREPSAEAEPTHASLTDELARFLVGQPHAIAELLRKHVPDERGKCRGCPIAQQGYLSWPCILYAGATLAAKIRRMAGLT